jgi:hypothetical protein
MAQFLHQLHFQSKLFLKIVLGWSKKQSRRGRNQSSSLRRQRLSRNTSSGSSFWLWGLGVAGVMLVWNWQLLLATLAGIGVLILLFQFPFDRWSVYWQKWQQNVNLPQRRLLMALVGSSLAGIGTYWALNLWDHLENHWLAGGAIAQGVIITFLLGLQVSSLVIPASGSTQRDRFSQLVGDLTAEHPLKRLMAIRELTQLAIRGNLQQQQLTHLSEYFSLLFAVETEPMLRQGLLESMQTLQLHHCWQNWETKCPQALQKLQKVKKTAEEFKVYSE